MVDYVIPANDDAVRAVKLVIGALTNAIAEVNGNEIMDCISQEDMKKSNKKDEPKKEEVKKEETVEPKKEEKVAKETPKKEVKEKVEEPKKEEVAKDLETKTLTELKAIAKEQGIKGYSTMKKADLIAILK